MTLTAILITFFDICLLVGVIIGAIFSIKIYRILCDTWIPYENINSEIERSNAKFDELMAFMKTTFNNEFAKKVEDIMRVKAGMPQTTKIKGDDGNEYEVPVDPGW